MTREQLKRDEENLYYEKYRESLNSFDEAETLTNDAHDRCHADIISFLEKRKATTINEIDSDELKQWLLTKGHSDNIVWWQIKNFKK